MFCVFFVLYVWLLLLLEDFDAKKVGSLEVDLLVDEEEVVAVDKLPPGLEGLELLGDTGVRDELLDGLGELVLVLVAVLLVLALVAGDDDAPVVELVVERVGDGTITYACL